MSTVFAAITTPGPPGRSPVWYTGSGVPSAGLGLDGDMYLNTANGDVYGPKASGAWGTPSANIKGPAGAAGATGATGPAGYSPLYIVAAGVPGAGVGNPGDMYINSTTSDLYGPKTGLGWGSIVANLRGNTGPQGPPGVAYTPRGAWSAATTYAQGDEVTDGSILYISLQSGNLNHVPASSPTWWQPVISGGFSDPTTTKGDLIVRGAAAPATRLPVGSNGQILIADSAQALGVKWGADISQTPWTSDIDGAGFTLKNAGKIAVGIAAPVGILHAKGPAAAPSITATNQIVTISAGSGGNGQHLQIGAQNASPWGTWLQGSYDNNPGFASPILMQLAGGNVGIGTANPNYLLHLTSASGVATQINLTQLATATWTIGVPASVNALTFSQNVTEFMRITATGNVGINTTAPGLNSASTPQTCVVQIKGALVLGGVTQTANEDGLIQLGNFNFVSANNWSGMGLIGQNLAIKSVGSADTYYTPVGHPSVGYAALQTHGSSFKFFSGTGATTAGGGITPTVRMTLDSSGNLGIGKTPSYPVDVAGDVNCTGVYRVNGTPISGSEGTVYIAYASSALTLTTSRQDVPGATVTLTRAGRYLITGVFSFNKPLGTGDQDILCLGSLVAGGSLQGQEAVFAPLGGASVAGIATVAQQWVYLATAGAVAKLQAYKTGGTGASGTETAKTSISAVWISST